MLLARLRRAGRPAQAQALQEAAVAGGRISRARVFELAHYSPTRSLKGWTRPVARLVEQLRDEGVIPADAVVPLVSDYDPRRTSYQQALGFLVPAEAVPAFATAD